MNTDSPIVWLAIALAGLLTFAARFSMLGLLTNYRLPERIQKLLTFVGPAAIAAIIAPDVLTQDGIITIYDNSKIPAFILATIVAFYAKNVVAILVCGMFALWVIEWWI